MAIKSVPKFRQGAELDPTGHDQILRESYLHLQLDHPNIVKLYDIYEDADEYHSVLEYCEGGTLSKRAHSLTEK